jgi:hypothetical protein
MVRGRVIPVLFLLAVVLATAWSLARFVAEGADTPTDRDVAAAAAHLQGQHLTDDDVVIVAPPWSMAPLRALGADARVAVAADGPWDVLHRHRHARVFLWAEPDAEPWLSGRVHDVLAAPASKRPFGAMEVSSVADVMARADFTRSFGSASVGLAGITNGVVSPCTEVSRGIGGGVRCAGQPRSVRVAREWAQVTENGADVIVVQPAPAPQALRIGWDNVSMGRTIVVAAGHLRQAVARLPAGKGAITIGVFVDDTRVAVIERQPSFIVEPQRRGLVERFVADRPARSGFVVDVVDTKAFAGESHRVRFEVTTDFAEGNAFAIDAFIPGGP